MKFIVLVCIFTLVSADSYVKNPRSASTIRDERYHSLDGRYSFDVETDNGIMISQGGQPQGEEQAVHSAGQISYPLDDGRIFTLKFVANENGYHPESPFLPVAPAFPHEIPDFVLKQIAFAQEQKKNGYRYEDE